MLKLSQLWRKERLFAGKVLKSHMMLSRRMLKEVMMQSCSGWQEAMRSYLVKNGG